MWPKRKTIIAQLHIAMKKQITYPLLFSFLFMLGCGNTNKPQEAALMQLQDITQRIDPEEGFIDVILKITDETKTDTSHIYLAKGLYKDKTIGLAIEVNANIPAGIVDGDISAEGSFVPNGVKLSSIGAESDTFIRALAELYGVATTKGFTKNPVYATAFSLNEMPVDLNQSEYYRLKLFFEEDQEELYSELFLNIDLADRELELSEKDHDYRRPLLDVMTK